jgi:anti-anti-sigma factor
MDGVVFRRERYGADAALVVVGEIDGLSAHTFRRELFKLLNSAHSVAWLDLTELWFVDAHGLNALLDAREVGLLTGVELVLRAPSLPVRRMLAVSGAADAFRLDDER